MSQPRMSAPERRFRSRLAKLVREEPLMRGTLSVRKTSCGKPSCHCATGQKHPTLYVVYSKQGKIHQIFVPKEMQQQVRRWVKNYHSVTELLEKVSEVTRKELRSRRR